MRNFTAHRFQARPLSAIKPRGWRLAQMRQGLTTGLAGCLDAPTERARRNGCRCWRTMNSRATKVI